MKALKDLKSVLCDSGGKVSICGSDKDKDIIQKALADLEKDIVEQFRLLCEESINPDLYSSLVDKIIPALKLARRALKPKDIPF